MYRWTDREKQFIKDNYTKMTDLEMAKILGKTEVATQHQRHVMKLNKANNIPWTDPEIKILWDNRHLSIKQLLPILPLRSYKQINVQRWRLRKQDPERYAEQPEIIQPHITDWKNYKPSYKSFTFDDDLILAVKIQQLLAVNYGRS